MEMSQLLRRTLERREIEVQELANYLMIHPTLISKWLNRKAPIPCYHLPGIARFTNEKQFLHIRSGHCPIHCAMSERVA